MGSDAIANGGAAKKKRINRSAKLKQCKLDARREQWLSQVKGRDDCKGTGCVNSPPPSPSPAHLPRPRTREINSKLMSREEDQNDGSLDVSVTLNSQKQNDPATGNRRRKSSPSNSVSSGSSVNFCSRSVSDVEEEEYSEGREEENGVLDDWEAVADALNDDDDDDHSNQSHDPASSNIHSSPFPDVPSDVSRSGASTKAQTIQSTPRAWTLDDTARPQSLPSLSKQWSFPVNFERQYSFDQQKCIVSLPLSCPICCEDLDPTDTSFLPCSCGFRLCLFCHKRILEADSRCPGCRKQYDTNLGSKASNIKSGQVPLLPFCLTRSCSMNARF